MKRPDSYTAAIAGDEPPPSTRGKIRLPGKRRLTGRQVQRTSVTLELNADLVPILRQLAEVLGTSPASVVDLLCYDALPRLAGGQLDATPHLVPSRSPRYAWLIDVDFESIQRAVSASLRPLRED